MKEYVDSIVTFAILDFQKPKETALALNSIRDRVKFPHKIHYYHNGPSEYAEAFLKNGLVDEITVSSVNNGLGIGTRNLMAQIFSPYTIYWQNDQVLGRNFELDELQFLIAALEAEMEFEPSKKTKSVSLAGANAGKNIYSERAHIIKSDFYRLMEFSIPLSSYGAGPYSHGPWREELIQKYYAENNYLHFTEHPPLAIDIGKWTLRNNPDGSTVKMRTDTKEVHWLTPPKEKYVFPDMTDAEWEASINGTWVNGTTPEKYKAGAFNCWDKLPIE